MAFWDHYYLPASVDDALAQLAQHDGRARVVAGGTDLLLELQQGRRPPLAALVDVTRIPEMTRIEERDGYLYVGAAVTHTRIVESALLARRATCLVESCGVIGGPQVRNVATLGGNVAHALPAGDGTLSLAALEAEAEVASYQSSVASHQSPAVSHRMWRPILSLFKGPGESAVDQTRELIVRFRFRPCGPGEGTAFERIMRPQGVALPVLALAVWVRVDAGLLSGVRIALGPAGPLPLRARKSEIYLRGRPVDDASIARAAELILDEAQLRTSKHRASADYRRELSRVLLERALPLAVRRAATGESIPEGEGQA